MREWKVIQKEDKRSICGRGDEESRRVKGEYFEDDTLTSIVGLGEETYKRELGGEKAEEDNEAVRVEKKKAYIVQRGWTQTQARLMYYCSPY